MAIFNGTAFKNLPKYHSTPVFVYIKDTLVRLVMRCKLCISRTDTFGS